MRTHHISNPSGWTKCFLAVICIALILILSPVSLTFAQSTQPIVALSPSSYQAQRVGETFSINVEVLNVKNLASWRTDISWDPTFLTLVRPSEGPFLTNVGQTQFGNLTLSNSTIEIEDTLYSGGGASGNGILATLIFMTEKSSVNSPITLKNTELDDSASTMIPHQVKNATVTLTSSNEIVANAGGDQTVNEDTPTILNGTETYPQDGNLTFTWTFTDRRLVTLSGKVVTYIFDMPGVYQVNLKVTDNQNKTSFDSTKITVKDTKSPVATITAENIGSNQIIEIGQTITFNGAVSYDPENGTITSYFWDLGNGSVVSDPEEFFMPSVTCEFNQTGFHTISLTVTEDGGNNSTATFSFTVRRADNPIDAVSLTILVAITSILLVCSPIWLLHRKRNR